MSSSSKTILILGCEPPNKDFISTYWISYVKDTTNNIILNKITDSNATIDTIPSSNIAGVILCTINGTDIKKWHEFFETNIEKSTMTLVLYEKERFNNLTEELWWRASILQLFSPVDFQIYPENKEIATQLVQYLLYMDVCPRAITTSSQLDNKEIDDLEKVISASCQNIITAKDTMITRSQVALDSIYAMLRIRHQYKYENRNLISEKYMKAIIANLQKNGFTVDTSKGINNIIISF